MPLAVPAASSSGYAEMSSTWQPAPGEVGQYYSPHFTDGETEAQSREGFPHLSWLMPPQHHHW